MRLNAFVFEILVQYAMGMILQTVTGVAPMALLCVCTTCAKKREEEINGYIFVGLGK